MACRLIDRIKIWPLYLLPKHFLSGLVYRLTRVKIPFIKNSLINSFIRLFNVDMKEAIKTDASDYDCFNAFFIRHLKPEARPCSIDNHAILSPVDGAISQIGTIQQDRLIQAKGRDYSLSALLAGDDSVQDFNNGHFATLYLSPRDYHRIHMPVSGKLIKSVYVPGSLFPVNNASVNTVDNLFARNERFISLFETELGLMAQIMVGAIFVGSMETTWLGQITPTRKRTLAVQEYNKETIELKQGDEFGHFNMGSTVILLFENKKMNWQESLKENDSIKVGQVLGKRV